MNNINNGDKINWIKQRAEIMKLNVDTHNMNYINEPSKMLKIWENIEKCGRTCYKSENRITPTSAIGFVKNLIKSGHYSVLEHVRLRIYIDPYILHEDQYNDVKTFLINNGLTYADSSLYDMKLFQVNYYDDQYTIHCTLRKLFDIREYLKKNEHEWPIIYPICTLFKILNWIFKDVVDDDGDYVLEKRSQDHIYPEFDISQISITEDDYMCVRFTTNRSVSHQLVRERCLSFSQESQRFVNYNNKGFKFIEPTDMNEECLAKFKQSCENAVDAYVYIKDGGCRPQRARGVLPNATATEIVVSGTYINFMNVINKRSKPDCDPDIRELMELLKQEHNALITVLNKKIEDKQ